LALTITVSTLGMAPATENDRGRIFAWQSCCCEDVVVVAVVVGKETEDDRIVLLGDDVAPSATAKEVEC
jgi:hypothetical protein